MDQGKSYDGASLVAALKGKALAGGGLTIVGMLKSAESDEFVSFTVAGCDGWVDIPVKLIEVADHVGEARCKDHSHPVFRIVLKESNDPIARVLAQLISQIGAQRTQGARPSHTNVHEYPEMSPPFEGGQPGFPHSRMPRRSGFSPFGTSVGNFGVGGLGGGGFGAWGCWDSCCETRCAAGRWVRNYALGRWVFECDHWVCVEPCERCIWPW